MNTLEKIDWKKDLETLPSSSLLLESSRILNSTLDTGELLEIILTLTCKVAQTELAALFLQEKKKSHMHYLTLKGKREDLLAGFGQGLIGWVAEHMGPLVINDPAKNTHFVHDLEVNFEVPIRNLIALPIQRRNKFLGVLLAVNRKGASEFAALDQEALSILVDQMAIALDNSFLYRRVKEESLKKEILLEIDRQLSSSLDLEEVLKTILNSVRKIVDCDAAGIFLVNNKTQEVEQIEISGYDPMFEADLKLKIGQGLIGYVAKTGESVIVPDVGSDPRYVNARPETRSEIVAPITLNGEIIGVFNLESNQLNAFDEDDLIQLKVFANQAAISIDRARLYKLAVLQRKVSEELSIARQIQASFLPKSQPEIPGFDIAGANIPSQQVGGDYYDFIREGENQLGIVVGDVSGKGIPSALIMASFRASLIAEIRNNFAIRTIFKKVNRLMYESMERNNFVTAVYGVLDYKNKTLTFSNAGHNPPVLLRAEGKVDFLQQGGLALGILPDVVYQEKTLNLQSGDIIVFYTDGVTESLNPSRQEFGVPRLIDLLISNQSEGAAELIKLVLEAVEDFTGGTRSDDITLVLVKVE